MKDDIHVLEIISRTNLVPLIGGKGKITAIVAYFLYYVSSGAPFCICTYIVFQMIMCHAAKCSIPFPRLVGKIIRAHGVTLQPYDASIMGMGKISMTSLKRSLGQSRSNGNSSPSTHSRISNLAAQMLEINERTKRIHFDESNTQGMLARLCAKGKCNVSEYEKTYEEYLAEQEQDDENNAEDEEMNDEDDE